MIDILYVEDDGNIAQIVKEYLQKKNCNVVICATIGAAKEAFLHRVPALVLLDHNMPDGDGVSLCIWLRSRWPDLPIIFLTVKNDTQDVICGFQNGADDYVIKPFELGVLHSRICALLRRAGNVSSNGISCGAIKIDKSRMMVFYQEKEVSVSRAEYQLLLFLLENKGKTVTREQLLEKIWDSNGNFVNDNTLTVTMKRLREKLNQPSHLKTIRSFGYRMEDTVCMSQKTENI